jgi:hypothetical protein
VPLGRALCRYRAGGAGLPGAISGPEERSRIETTEKAILAGDCFWGMQDLLRKRPDVISTRVGYLLLTAANVFPGAGTSDSAH